MDLESVLNQRLSCYADPVQLSGKTYNGILLTTVAPPKDRTYAKDRSNTEGIYIQN